jgi:hypothetical protein
MDTTPVNIIIVIAAFSCFAFFGWLVELWYLNSRLKDRHEPQLFAGYQELQRYYSRKINATRDHTGRIPGPWSSITSTSNPDCIISIILISWISGKR